MDVYLSHVYGLDSEFAPKRLQNAVGFLTSRQTGSGEFRIEWTQSPTVSITTQEISDDGTFSYLLITDANGQQRRLYPANAADGYLRASAGGWKLEDPSAITPEIPDPLTITTINASNVNAENLTVSGLSTFSSLNTDTITTVIGLNASNQLVKGTSQTISVAKFYESSTLTSANRPNYTLASSNAYVQFSNEIVDADGIASPTNVETLKIDKTGSYTIEWGGYFGATRPSAATAGTTIYPSLWLEINGTIVNYGDAIAVEQNFYRGGSVHGVHVATLNQNDVIKLKANDARVGTPGTPVSDTGSGLSGVNLTLTKYK